LSDGPMKSAYCQKKKIELWATAFSEWERRLAELICE
jgi:hypothetical protein